MVKKNFLATKKGRFGVPGSLWGRNFVGWRQKLYHSISLAEISPNPTSLGARRPKNFFWAIFDPFWSIILTRGGVRMDHDRTLSGHVWSTKLTLNHP